MAETDQILVAQTLSGRLEAFGLLVERYSGLVWALVLERVRRWDEVEDLVQETFCAAYQALPDLRDPTRFAPWLCQIARTTALRWTRRERLRQQVEEHSDASLPAPAPGPEEALAAAEQDQALWQTLDALPEPVRQLVVLRHLEGCSYRELGRFLGLSTTAVRWRLLRAEQQVTRGVVQRLGEDALARRPDRQRLRRRVLAGLALGVSMAPRGEALPLAWWSLGRLLPLLKTAVPACVGMATTGALVAHLSGVPLPGWPASVPADEATGAAISQDAPIRVQLAPPPALPGPAACELPATPPDSRRLAALGTAEAAAATGPESTSTVPEMPATPSMPAAVPGEKERFAVPEPALNAESTSPERRITKRAQIHGIAILPLDATGRLRDGTQVQAIQGRREPPKGIAELFYFFKARTEIGAVLQWVAYPLTQPKEVPLGILYLDGESGPLLFDQAEKQALAERLQAGALLYAEDAQPGDPGSTHEEAGTTTSATSFGERFKALIRDRWVLGDQGTDWRSIPLDHPIYFSYSVFPSGLAQDNAPYGTSQGLEMLELRGRLAVILSHIRIHWYQVNNQDSAPERSLQFGVNLLSYAAGIPGRR